MTETSNIDTFNTLVGLIFEQLYQEFPVATGLNTDDIAATLGVQGYTIKQIATGQEIVTDWGELMDGSEFWTFYRSALEWLEAEGLIRQPEDREYVLTASALTALNAKPNALQEPLGKRLQGVAIVAGTEAGKAAIAEVVGQVIGTAMRSFAGSGG